MEEIPEHNWRLSNCFKRVYGPEITKDKFKEIAGKYGKFKGYWTYSKSNLLRFNKSYLELI